MELLDAAGLPPGVVNLVTGSGAAVSEVALVHPSLAGIHFTGSTATFRHLWAHGRRRTSSGTARSRALVGETGGKDFVVAHASADPDAVVTGLLRGAFDYQGQKCSAASRAYLPRSFADRRRARPPRRRGGLARLRRRRGPVGRSGARSSTGAASTGSRGVLQRLRDDPTIEVVAGGTAQDKVGYFVEPDRRRSARTRAARRSRRSSSARSSRSTSTTTRGSTTCSALVDATSPYALTGAVFATDRAAIAERDRDAALRGGELLRQRQADRRGRRPAALRGARASGTNDKAGSIANLERWVSPRTIKETFVAADRPPLPAHGARRRVNPLRGAILAASRSTRVRATVESVARHAPRRRPVRRGGDGRRRARVRAPPHRRRACCATVDHLGEEVADAAGADATVDGVRRAARRARRRRTSRAARTCRSSSPPSASTSDRDARSTAPAPCSPPRAPRARR